MEKPASLDMTTEHTMEDCTPVYDDDPQNMDKLISILVPVLFGVIFVFGLIGNICVIVVMLGKRFKQIRNSTNMLIVNLACANLMFILFCVPFTASDYVLAIWPFGSIWCKAVQYLVHLCAYASAYTLVLLSVDRYLAMWDSTPSKFLRTKRTARIGLGVLWGVILAANLPLLKVHGLRADTHNCETRMPCIFHFEVHDEAAFRIGFLVSFFALPVVIMFIVYILMLLRLGKRSRESMLDNKDRPKKRLTWMVIAAAVVFALCWGPISIILALKAQNLYPINAITVPIQVVAHVLAYSYACLNPFIYVATHPGFRSGFKNLLCCGRGQRSSYHSDFETTDERDTKSSSVSFSRDSQPGEEVEEGQVRLSAADTMPERKERYGDGSDTRLLG